MSSYDNYLNGLQQQDTRNNQLKSSLSEAAQTNPNDFANMVKLSRAAEIQVDAVPDYKDVAQAAKVFGEVGVASLWSDNPKTASFLSDPIRAKLSYDDSENLKQTEGIFGTLKNIGSAAFSGITSANAGLYGVGRSTFESLDTAYGYLTRMPSLSDLNSVANANTKAAKEITNAINYGSGAVLPEQPFTPAVKFFEGSMLPEGQAAAPAARPKPFAPVGEMFAGLQQRTQKYAESFMPQGDGVFSRGGYSGVASLTRNVATLPLLFAGPKGQQAYLAMAVAPVFGESYGQARDAGLSVADSNRFAAGQAAIEYATEKMPVSWLMKDLKAGAPLYKTLIHQAASEIPGEQAATVLQDLNEWATLNPEKPFKDYLAERPSAAAETLIATIIGVGGQTTLVHGASRAAEHFSRKEEDANRAAEVGQSIGRLADLAASSKLRERDGQTFREWIDHVSDDSPVQNVYVKADVLRQAGVVDELAKVSPSVATQIVEAEASGGEVKIPVQEYLEKIAPTNINATIIEDLRAEGESTTTREARAFLEQQKDELKQAYEESIKKAMQDETFVKSAKEVESKIYDQLKGAGVYSDQASRVQAQMTRDFFVARAAYEGKTPAQVLEQYNYQIREAQRAQQAPMFSQADTTTPEFVNWFDGSKVVDQGGKPIKLYHGTNDEFTKFDMAKAGDGAMWFTPIKEHAQHFARGAKGNVVDAYLSIKNPMVISQDDLDAAWDKAHPSGEQDERALLPRDFVADFVKKAKKAGHDGLVIKDFGDLDHTTDVYLPFDSKQIKSASKNNGQYDPNNPDILKQTAYHGSPFRFDKFSLEHMGKGEGAQAYGWGLYFASMKDVAEWYRDNLSSRKGENPTNKKIAGKTPMEWYKHFENLAIKAKDPGTYYDRMAMLEELEITWNAQAALNNGKAEGYDKAALDWFEKTIASKFDRPGATYTVDIPEDSEMLAWDEKLSGKAKDVVDAFPPELIAALEEETGEKLADMKGSDVYGGLQGLEIRDRVVSQSMDADQVKSIYAGNTREAGAREIVSRFLNSKGIEGVKYLDQSSRGVGNGTHNYVIFDDKTIKVLDAFYQSQNDGNVRGGFDPSTLTTLLTEKADLSTYLHETGHFFLTVYSDLAASENASPQVKADMQTLLDWFGVPDLATWNAMSLEEQRKYHEQFAYNYEIYLFEGKAPSVELQNIFQRFTAWLKRVYVSIRDDLNAIYKREHGADLPILTGEVRQVMDRMLASEDQIRQAEAIRNFTRQFMTQEEAGMDDATWAAYQAMEQEQHDASVESLQKATLRQMKWLSNARGRLLKEMQKQADAQRKEIAAQVADEVKRERVFNVISFLKRGKAIINDQEVEASEGNKLSIAALNEMYGEPKAEKIKKRKQSNGFMNFLVQHGISMQDKSDVGADKGKRYRVGLFRNDGLRLDELAKLAVEQGYLTEQDIEDPSDNGGVNKLADMISAALGGDTILTLEEQYDAAAEEMSAQQALDEQNRKEQEAKDEVEQLRAMGFSEAEIHEMTSKPDWQKLGYGKYGMLAENGLHPDEIAEIFGFASGDQMIRAIVAAPKMSDVIEARTDQRMLEEHSDLVDPKQVALAVEEALHNEARARFVAVELRHLAKATQPVRLMVQAAKSVASGIINRTQVGEINPREYSIAEGRAAKQAIDASKKGDTQAAIKAKKDQLLQNQLAAAAVEAQREVDKAFAGFKRMFKSDEKLAKTRNMDLVNAARAILSYYGIGPKMADPSSFVEKIKAYSPEIYAEIEPIIMRAAAGSTHYEKMSVEDFRAMRDTVEALWFQSKRDKQVMIDGNAVALKEVVDELNARLEEIGVPEHVAGESQAPSQKDRAIRQLFNAKALTRRVEHWADATDGPTGPGPFTKYIWRPVRSALDQYRLDRNKYVKQYVELIGKLDLPVGKIEAPEIGYTFGNENGGVGKAELLGAVLHMGNESNLKKLLLGRGWGTKNAVGMVDASRWNAFVSRMFAEGKLTKADMDFVQAVWDLNEELKPLAQKAHHDVFGYYFKEVEATPLVTPFGNYRGGYVPAKTDPFLVRDAQKNAKMEELEGDFRFAMPSTGMGFTKSRVEYNKPLSLDLRLGAKHIDDVIRFAHVQPAVRDALKILRNREFGDTLTRLDPTAIEDMLIPWLNRAARQITSEVGKSKAVDTFWRTVRTRTGISIMFANFSNALQQITGYFPALLKTSPTYLKSALAQYVSGPQQMTENISALSPFMADRLSNQLFDLQDNMNELLLNPSKFQKIQAWSKHHGYFLQSAFQNQVDVVTWSATYNETMAELSAKVDDEAAKKEAVARADAAVRLTQSSLAPEDIAAFEVGTPFYKTFIQFSGYFNMLANLNADGYIKIVRDLGWRGNKGKLVYQYMMGFALPMLISDAIVRTLGGGWDDDDEDGYLDVFMSWFFGSQIKGAAALVPLVGQASLSIANAFNDKPYDDRMTTSPSVSTLEAATFGVAKAAINIVSPDKEVTGKNVRDVLTLLSLATGIPMTVLGRPIGYEVDVQRGKVHPTSAADEVRGVLTGKASESSKR